MHGRVTRNNTSGIIPTSEGGGKKRRAEDIDWTLTKAEQERVNEYKWSQVPTYEGDRGSKRVATSEGGNKAKQEEPEKNFYDCLSEEDEPDEEMEPAPTSSAGGVSGICQDILRDLRNKRRQERNANRRTAREDRRQRREATKQQKIIKEASKRAKPYTKEEK